VATRARIVLLAANGQSTRRTARRLGVNPRTVMLWRRRYREHGAHSLWRDAPGRGRKATIDAAAIAHVHATLSTTPPDGVRWTIRRLAVATGLSRASVHRIVCRCTQL
jgi:transposase